MSKPCNGHWKEGVKPATTVFIYAALAMELRYHAMTKGYNIEVPAIYDLSRTRYQSLRNNVLYYYNNYDLLAVTVDSVMEKLDYLLEKNLTTERIELYRETGRQVAKMTRIESADKYKEEKILKIIAMLDAAYLFAIDPADNLKTEEVIARHIQDNKIIANGS